MVVDRQMHVLPSDPAGVALAVAVAGDPIADPIELAQLLDVDVDDLAWGGAFIAADRLGRLERRRAVLRRNRFRMRLTVAAETPTSAAICSPVWRCLRKASILAHVAGAVWLGDKRGRDERSCKPATPWRGNARPSKSSICPPGPTPLRPLM
jgi:hypothetical protein